MKLLFILLIFTTQTIFASEGIRTTKTKRAYDSEIIITEKRSPIPLRSERNSGKQIDEIWAEQVTDSFFSKDSILRRVFVTTIAKPSNREISKTSQWYDSHGILEAKKTRRNGEIVLPYTTYYPNGVRESVIRRFGPDRSGYEQKFYQSGFLQQELFYLYNTKVFEISYHEPVDSNYVEDRGSESNLLSFEYTLLPTKERDESNSVRENVKKGNLKQFTIYEDGETIITDSFSSTDDMRNKNYDYTHGGRNEELKKGEKLIFLKNYFSDGSVNNLIFGTDKRKVYNYSLGVYGNFESIEIIYFRHVGFVERINFDNRIEMVFMFYGFEVKYYKIVGVLLLIILNVVVMVFRRRKR